MISLLVGAVLAAFPAHAKWIWLQEQNFKSLEARGINSDFVMTHFSSGAIAALWKDPNVSTIFGTTFRDVVFEIEDRKFSTKNLEATIQRLLKSSGRRIDNKVGDSPDGKSWTDWLSQGIRHGLGTSPEQAFINMKLNEFQMSFEDWKVRATEIRAVLFQAAERAKVDWRTVLEASRRYGRDPKSMSNWATWVGFGIKEGVLLAEYGRLLTLADYLDPALAHSPLPKMRALEREIRWNYLLVVDVKGMGTTNRMAQDQWFANGADPQKIFNVSQAGDLWLEEVGGKVKKDLGKFQVRGAYSIGDSLVFGLELKGLTEVANLESIMGRNPDIHFVVLERTGAGLRPLLDQATRSLKSAPIRTCLGYFL